MKKPVRPVVLCVLDGFGERAAVDDNPIRLAKTPVLDALRAWHPVTLLDATASESSRLPCGASGHMCLGAGRRVTTLRERIDRDAPGRKLWSNPTITQTMRIAAFEKRTLHLIGVVSASKAHASFDHLLELTRLAVIFYELTVMVHVILDGRDASPRVDPELLYRLQWELGKHGRIATLSGRAYGLDTGGRWDRTYKAYQAIVRDRTLEPKAPQADTVLDALHEAYVERLNDDLVEPTRIGEYRGMDGSFMCDFARPKSGWQWIGEDVGFAFNHRPDGLRQLKAMLLRGGVPDDIAGEFLVDRGRPVFAFREHCMASLGDEPPDTVYPVAYAAEQIAGNLGEIVASAGLSQLRVAESEKAYHVGSFFNGGRTAPYDGEERRIIPSRDDFLNAAEAPEQRVGDVARAVADALAAGSYDFILVNLGNVDVVAQTGRLEATILAVEALDSALGQIAHAASLAGGVLCITADHGRAENLPEQGISRLSARTGNPVPFILVGAHESTSLREGGCITDVAATVLELLGLEPATGMSGSLLVKHA